MADDYELGTVGPIPTVNPNVAKIGEMLKLAKKYADQYYVKENVPLIGGTTLGEFLLGKAPEEVERWGQGDYPFRNPSTVVGTGGNRLDVWKTGRFEPTFDVAANVALPITAGYRKTLKSVAPKAYEKLEDYMIKTGGIQQMMAGEKSKTFNPELKKAAIKLEKENADPTQIWEATGLVRGPDKKWRTEINDQFSKLKENPLLQDKEWAKDKNYSDFGALYETKLRTPGSWGRVHLSDVFEHPELEKAYPHLFDKRNPNGITIKLAPEDARYMGRVEDEGRTIVLRSGVKADDARRIINHELEHVIQKYEGHATGGSPDTYTQQADAKLASQALAVRREAERMDENVPWGERVKGSYILHRGLGMDLSPEVLKVAENRMVNPTKDMENLTMLYGTDKSIEPATPLRMYEKIAGEAEARLTENRMNLSDAERRANFPYKYTPRTYDENLQPRPILGLDVPLNEQIVHGHKPNTIDIGGKRIFGSADETLPESYDYRGVHKAPTNDDYHSPAYELGRGMYPEDVYGPNGHHYYGTGDNKMDRAVLDVLREARGNPDHPITVYRAVPAKYKDQDINPGDWITPSLDYAHQHGLRFDSHHIIEKTVPAKHLWSEGNSLHEFGYDPTE